MAVAALCWVSTADAQSAGTTQAQGSFSRPATKRSGDCINFNRLPAGQIPSQVFGRRGTGPVFLLGVNPTLGGNPNAAVIFDSTNPTGTDIDLGTPNEDFGGPGVGDGGESGSPFQNDADLGRLLIVGEDLVDLNNDDLVDDPDDADVVDARLEFDFSSVGPVVIDSITQVDTETDREIPLVEFFDDTNSLITTRRLQQPGNNGVATTEIVGVYNVTRMVINLFGSGAIDNVCFTEMVDCNDNGIPDDIDIDTGTSDDCNNNGVPDECEDDCDNDGIPDTCEDDCDNDGTPDDCEPDCDNDGTPDDCEDDCDNDGTPDDCEPDCDSDGIPDDCEPDCDNDGLPDDCEPDCDSDGTPDDCEDDCDNDGTPDDCEPDCDDDGTPDDCETGPDCNSNGIPDECELDGNDCDSNGVPDECDPDCDNDGTPDDCELDCDNDGTPDDCEPDCDSDGIPDDCEPDCDNDGLPDDCEPDCDSDGTPDDCEDDCDNDGTPDDCEPDCDNDGTPDDCEPDCDSDGTPDDCEDDCDNDGTPDDCEPDCDNDGTPDDCETGPDCNSNGIPDECELDGNDCDSNGIPDECDLDCDNDGTPDDCEPDCDSDGTPDDCEPDCDSDGTPDDCEPDCDSDGIPDDCETDTDGNGIPDECEDCDDDGIPDGDEPDCDDDGIPDDCEDDCNANGVPDDCEGCLETLNIVWDANDCLAFSDASFFHEFTGQVVGGCSNLGVYPTNLDEPNGMHSCTDDAITGDPGDAFCVAADSDSSYDLDDDDDRVMFSVTLDETAGSTATLTDFSFWHKAPFTAITSDEGGQNGSEENDPPEFYGVRIFRDGAEVFFMQDIPTSPDWVETVFDFSGDANFMVSSDTVVFDFELMGYAPINDNGGPQIWDLDEFNVSVCCSEGGSSNDCDGDGTPDFCELDCNENGIPDDCDIIDGTSWDDDNNGIPDECECAPAAWPTEEGSWDLSGEMWAVFSFGSDNYWIDCMTVTHDGNGNLHVVGEATGSSGTLSIDFTYTCSFSGSDLVSSNPDNDTGSMTHVGTGETIPLEGKSNGSYSGALISTGAFTAEFSGWLSNANTGQLVGDWDPHVDADATCTPCN